MKIEAVTVSINFSDFLIKCVENKKHFDRWMIVTTDDDKKTIELCKSNNLEYTITKRLKDNNSVFAKGKAINDGLNKLDRDDWLLQLDSDILLQNNFRSELNKLKLNKDSIYWMNRYVNNNGIVYRRNKGKCCGYFQLWHSSFIKLYPEYGINACLDDKLHRRMFGKNVFRLKRFSCVDVSGDRKFYNGRKI